MIVCDRFILMNQADILRKLDGNKRLEQAFKLSDFVRELMEQNIKEMYGKGINRKELQKKLRERLYPSYCIPI